METIHLPEEFQKIALKARAAGKKIALVPTMGNLHDGHASLIDIARKNADLVAVSVFVNPTQFAPNEDYDKYPRTLKADEKLCAEHGADIVFAPAPDAIYAKDASTFVVENACSQGLCGRYRPTHFRGVCTVVNLLFNLAQPNVAVFGQKDAQQVAVLKRMVRDLHIPVEIIVAPIVREDDGLALSSRNKYLSARERAVAPQIYAGLNAVKRAVSEGVVDVAEARKIFEEALHANPLFETQYFECVDATTMSPLSEIVPRETLVAVAVFMTETRTRLIDNIRV